MPPRRFFAGVVRLGLAGVVSDDAAVSATCAVVVPVGSVGVYSKLRRTGAVAEELELELELEEAELLDELPAEPLFEGVAAAGSSPRVSLEGCEADCSVFLPPNLSVNWGINFFTPKNTPPTMSNVIRKREKGVKRLIT